MVENKFKINRFDGKVVLEKDNKKMVVSKTIDYDFWFYTNEDELVFELNVISSSYYEFSTHLIFESLIKSIIGRYFLTGEYKNMHSDLPEDFISLDDNTIIWHSDGSNDNVLKLEYNKSIIKVTISKSKDCNKNDKNSVRIRSNGSSYGFYYQEFIKFYDELLKLAVPLDRSILDDVDSKNEEKQKKKSLFKDWFKK